MPPAGAFILRLVLGSLIQDTLKLLAALLSGALLCLLAALVIVPSLLFRLPAGVIATPTGPGPQLPSSTLVGIFQEVAGATGIRAGLLLAIGFTESRFNPRAVGPLIERFAGTEDAHALGMMQFLPSTYRAYAGRVDRLTGERFGPDGIWDARASVYAAALFLSDMGAPADEQRALLRYNDDEDYVAAVLRLAAEYEGAIAGDGVAERALTLARTQLGQPYLWGGVGNGGFDCSGLVQWAYRGAGATLPRTAEQQYHATQRVPRERLRPGDPVFFEQPDPEQPGVTITHVGLYAGDGLMIDAPAPGQVVRLEPLWRSFAGGGRVIVSR